jgi:hypothetical protein
MRFRLLSVPVLCLWVAASHAQQPEKSALERDPKGWIDLTPGKDLKGWRRVLLPPDTALNPKNPWKVEGDVLACDGVGVKEMLLYDKEFGDGVFHLEWRFRKAEGKQEYNSGAYVRSTLDGKTWHQIQIAHQEKPPLLGDVFTTRLVKDRPEMVVIRGEADKRARGVGEWNTYEITTKGSTVEVWVNGATTCTWKECPLKKGHVGMQAEFYFIEFRNLKFKER